MSDPLGNRFASITLYGSLGVLSLGVIAVTLLSLNQADRAGAYVDTVARAQQSYFLEKGDFTDSLDDLQMGLLPLFANYSYGIGVQEDGASVMITAIPDNDSLKYYASVVFAVEETSGVATTVTEVCEGSDALRTTLPTLNPETGTVDCPPGASPLS